jgi:transcriptional regulator with XRE-family HTH domain
MDSENLKIRLYRALSGRPQVETAREIGVDVATYGHYEGGLMKPGPDKLERAARVLGVGDEFGDEVLELLDLRRRKRLRAGRGIEDLLDDHAQEMRTRALRAYERLLTLPLPVPLPSQEDRRQAREQLPDLLDCTPSQRAAVLKLSDEHHAWALAIEAGESAVEAADPEEAARRASTALDFAALVEGPAGWPEAVRSRALEYQARVQQRLGKVEEAEKALADAKRLAEAASDPYGVLG